MAKLEAQVGVLEIILPVEVVSIFRVGAFSRSRLFSELLMSCTFDHHLLLLGWGDGSLAVGDGVGGRLRVGVPVEGISALDDGIPGRCFHQVDDQEAALGSRVLISVSLFHGRNIAILIDEMDSNP